MASAAVFDKVQTESQAIDALVLAGYSNITELAQDGRNWTAVAAEGDGTVQHVTVHGRNGAVTIEDDVDEPAPDLQADVLKLLDELAAVRAISNSLVDQMMAIRPHLDRLVAQYEDLHVAVHGEQPAEPAPEPAPEPVPEPVPVAETPPYAATEPEAAPA